MVVRAPPILVEGQFREVPSEVAGRESGKDLSRHLGLVAPTPTGHALIDPLEEMRILLKIR
jgi:hypothetical protein